MNKENIPIPPIPTRKNKVENNEQIPVPKPKTNKKDEVLFERVQERQTCTEFRQNFRRVLFDLYDSLPANKAKLRELINRFVGVLYPNTTDVLPYYSKGIKSARATKEDCLLSLISFTIQLGWKFQLGESTSELPDRFIKALETITKVGLDELKVRGNDKGYYLEMKDGTSI